ncbi:hypothetical protein BaRGS_00039993, partial [Batillaria attramentaria]
FPLSLTLVFYVFILLGLEELLASFWVCISPLSVATLFFSSREGHVLYASSYDTNVELILDVELFTPRWLRHNTVMRQKEIKSNGIRCCQWIADCAKLRFGSNCTVAPQGSHDGPKKPDATDTLTTEEKMDSDELKEMMDELREMKQTMKETCQVTQKTNAM